MPIHCSDLVEVIYSMISKNNDLNIIECVGPEALSFKEILQKLLKSIDKKNFVTITFNFCKFFSKNF